MSAWRRTSGRCPRTPADTPAADLPSRRKAPPLSDRRAGIPRGPLVRSGQGEAHARRPAQPFHHMAWPASRRGRCRRNFSRAGLGEEQVDAKLHHGCRRQGGGANSESFAGGDAHIVRYISRATCGWWIRSRPRPGARAATRHENRSLDVEAGRLASYHGGRVPRQRPREILGPIAPRHTSVKRISDLAAICPPRPHPGGAGASAFHQS